MKRFNMLVVKGNGQKSAEYVKMMKKVERRNFVIEVGSIEEANSLLDHLEIDLILLDLDKADMGLKSFQASRPNIIIVGTSSTGSSPVVASPSQRFRILPKNDFATAFPAELKAIRKELSKGSRMGFGALRALTRSDFKNFNQLVASN